MKIFLLVLLMMILPVQASMAAIGGAHAHTDCTQGTHQEHEAHAVTPCAHGAADHCPEGHHHCHATTLGVLSQVAPLCIHLPSTLRYPDGLAPFQSFLSSRIERPKWA